MQQPLYGLIGGKLGHSYSKIIHEKIADYTYELLPLPTEAEARTFMEKRAFAAINVTIPYKQFVIPYCDVVDPKAQAIGAVNTIVNRDGKLYGYNTDYAGFAYLAGAHGVDFAGKTVLILGTGGTHSTVTAVCRDGGAKEILTASRTGKGDALLYSEAMHRPDVQIIVNTTPCGMFPNVGQCLIDPKAFPALEAVLDVVYNPFRTELLLRAEDCGVIAAGGFEMLVAQAVYAAEYFLDRKFDDAPAEIRAITAQLRKEQLNVALIGMPSCGKTTIGKLIAGLYRPSGGRIMLFGKPQNPKQLQKQVLFILQEAEFQFFTGSVLHELQYGHAVTPEFEAKTEALLKSMDLWDCRNRHPFSLSGGQMQRLMIARIFLLKPKILLADEPTSMVDACSRATILDMLLQLRDEIGMTVIFITHDIGLAYYISDTVYIMEHGRCVEFGKADEVILNPKAAYTKRLISDVPKIHEEWDLSTVELK